ncbi:unnamed protein product [Calypogeia fissa]
MGLPVRGRALGASSGQAGAADSEKQAGCRMIRSKGNERQTGGNEQRSRRLVRRDKQARSKGGKKEESKGTLSKEEEFPRLVTSIHKGKRLGLSAGAQMNGYRKCTGNMFRAVVFFHGLSIEAFGPLLPGEWLIDEPAVGLAGCYDT